MLGQACVSWPIRADWVFVRGALKRQELKRSVSDRGGIQSCSTGQYEKPDVFLSIKGHTLLLIVTQNIIMYLKISYCYVKYISFKLGATVASVISVFVDECGKCPKLPWMVGRQEKCWNIILLWSNYWNTSSTTDFWWFNSWTKMSIMVKSPEVGNATEKCVKLWISVDFQI